MAAHLPGNLILFSGLPADANIGQSMLSYCYHISNLLKSLKNKAKKEIKRTKSEWV